MRYAALDLSSHTGWGCWNGLAPQPTLGTKTIVGWSYDTGSMLELYRKWLGSFIAAYQPNMVAIESWYIPQHMDATTIGKQIAVSAFTQWALKKAGIEVHLVTSTSWRKSWYGTARGKTEEFKRKAVDRCRQLEWPIDDHNSAEAAGLLDYLVTEIGRETPPWRSNHLFMPIESELKRRA